MCWIISATHLPRINQYTYKCTSKGLFQETSKYFVGAEREATGQIAKTAAILNSRQPPH